eukprot:5503965-Pyramimonas_sp.AAC.1
MTPIEGASASSRLSLSLPSLLSPLARTATCPPLPHVLNSAPCSSLALVPSGGSVPKLRAQ